MSEKPLPSRGLSTAMNLLIYALILCVGACRFSCMRKPRIFSTEMLALPIALIHFVTAPIPAISSWNESNPWVASHSCLGLCNS
jgi:hypothetical protein